MTPIYRYSINGHEVYPQFSSDLAKEYELESGQQFFRENLKGSLTFVREDYDWIMAQAFATNFVLLIEKSNDKGTTWATYFTGQFTKTDCKMDDDLHTISTDVKVKDVYEDILAELDTEYDLIRLGTKTSSVWYEKRPLIQIYSPGEKVLSCFIAGNYWEQDTEFEVSSRTDLIQTYNFAICNAFKTVILAATGGAPSTISGEYYGALAVEGDYMKGYLYSVEDTGYKLYISMLKKDVNFTTYENMVMTVMEPDDTALYTVSISADGDYDTQTLTLVSAPGEGMPGTVGAEVSTKNIFGRYLLDAVELNGVTVSAIPVEDIYSNPQRYLGCIGYGLNIGYMSREWSEEPTEWGRVPDEITYYNKPLSIWDQTFFPIARSTWSDYSYWFGFYYNDSALEKLGRVIYQVKDSYRLSEVISGLLNKISPSISFDKTAEYSQFLYGMVNPVTSDSFELLISPKSNVIASGGYSAQSVQSAQKAPITFGEVLTMLSSCFKCYWFIENGKFRLEHVSFFRNGGTYTEPHEVGTDLTLLENARLKKKWAFNTTKLYFDKEKIDEKIKFSWMDDVSQAFTGYPIIMKNPYVNKGGSEDLSVSKFTTDVDFVVTNPNEVSPDGFVLFACKFSDILIYPEYGYLEVIANVGYSAFIPLRKGRSWRTYRKSTAIPSRITLKTVSSASGIGHLSFFSSTLAEVPPQIDIPLVLGEQTITIDIALPSCAVFRFYSPSNTTFTIYSFQILDQFESIYLRRTIGGIEYNMQNGILSWINLTNYYLSDLPCRSCNVNNEDFEAGSTARNKKQNVTFPSMNDPDTTKLIKTYAGSGQIEKLSVNLQSRMNDIVLMYDTE